MYSHSASKELQFFMESEGSSPYPLRPIIISDPEFGAVHMIQVMHL